MEGDTEELADGDGEELGLADGLTLELALGLGDEEGDKLPDALGEMDGDAVPYDLSVTVGPSTQVGVPVKFMSAPAVASLSITVPVSSVNLRLTIKPVSPEVVKC